MDHTVLPANYTMPAFTPQPQSITALWLVLWSGLPLTSMRENYLYGTEDPVPLHHHCYVEYPKDRSLDRSFSFCTRQTYLDSSKVWIFIHTFTRTIHRFTDSVLRMKSLLFSSASQPVSPKHRNG